MIIGRRKKNVVSALLCLHFNLNTKDANTIIQIADMNPGVVWESLEKAEATGKFQNRYHFTDMNRWDERASAAMDVIDFILGGHGVEPIRDPNVLEGYWGDTVALYSNRGDTYDATVVYDVNSERFELTSWGDWVEANLQGEEEEDG